jgi:putative ABC transport system substrate-binding protein
MTPILYLSLTIVMVVAGATAQAQQPRKMTRIGVLSWLSGPSPTVLAFREGLRELGWVEGKQIECEYRYAGGDLKKLSEFATEFVRLKTDVIVAGPDNAPTHAAKRVSTTTPIVMVGVVEPINDGLVASLARPGGNVTGLTWEATREQAGKNLELLKEAVPNISRVAILRNPNVSSQIRYSSEAERVAKMLGVTIQFAEMQARDDKDLKKALAGIVAQRANALLVTPYTFFVVRREQIIDFSARHKLPAIYFANVFPNDGGLMSYAPSGQDIWRRAAWYVDKILKGTKPADLPVEQPKKFELIVNLKAAKQIGLNIPPNVLARADKVIR